MFENIKQKAKWIAVAIAACVISFLIGWNSKKPSEIIQVEEKIVEKVVEKIVEVEKKKQQKITKITKKPDGTTTTTTIDTSSEISVAEKDSSSSVEKNTTQNTEKAGTSIYMPQYSAGIEAIPDISSLDVSYRVGAGYRVLGNMWIIGGYSINSNELGVGLRVDF